MVEQAHVESFINADGAREDRIVPAGDPEHPASKRILTIEDIRNAEDVLEASLYVPEWGGTVKLRQFTKKEEMDLRAQATIGGEVDRHRLELLLVIHGVVDPPLTEEHLGLLASKSQLAVDRVLKKVMGMNALGAEAADKATATFSDE